MPSEIAAEREAAGGTEVVESAEKATTEMAERAGEHPVKVGQTGACEVTRGAKEFEQRKREGDEHRLLRMPFIV